MSSDFPVRKIIDIAHEIDKEANPTTIRALARELNEAVLHLERERVAHKLRKSAGLRPVSPNQAWFVPSTWGDST